MSIMELGALGEFLGSIGVIATLIYLAVQIRANTNSTKAETFQRLTNEVTNWNTTLVLEPKLVEFVLDIADLNRELTPVEQLRLEAFAMAIFRQWDNVIYQGELGTIDKLRVEGCLFAMPTFLSVPRLRASWAEHRGAFSPGLNQRVDKWLEANVETKLSIG